MFELTEYEMERKAQKISADTEISISPYTLHRELMCPICLEILDQTMTTRECLHRFCSVCINKALRSGNKECPTCRKKLTSRRCLRADPNFDQLIKKIYKDDQDRPQETSNSFIAPECEIILRSLNGARTRFIKCPEKTTVEHLSKYLAMRPERNGEETYILCIVSNKLQGEYNKLDGSLKLEDVKETYKLEKNKPLEIYFYVPNTKEKD